MLSIQQARAILPTFTSEDERVASGGGQSVVMWYGTKVSWSMVPDRCAPRVRVRRARTL